MKIAGFKPVDLRDTLGGNYNCEPAITVNDHGVMFNSGCCRELDYPSYIEVQFNSETKEIAVNGRDTQGVGRAFFKSKKAKSGKSVSWTGVKIHHVFDVLTNRKDGEKIRLIGEKRDTVLVFSMVDKKP